MNTVTATLTTYNFSELAPAVQQKVIERNRDINTMFADWHDFILDYWKDEKLPPLGFDDVKIWYSGFNSQGDGASFEATVDLIKFLKVHHLCNQFRTLYNALVNDSFDQFASVKQSGHYYHEYTMSASYEAYGIDGYTGTRYERLLHQANCIESVILDTARDLAKQIYKELEQAYESDTSDESIKDTIESNECQFLEDGTPAPVIWKHYKNNATELVFDPGRTNERFNHVEMNV